VVSDHLGTPLALYNGQGQLTWTMALDTYGGVQQGRGRAQDCPFRYQGQYEDVETGLYYNRFRYYDPEVGSYISQDPARVIGGIKLYAYVANPSSWIDEFGLACAQVKNGVLEIKQKFPAGSAQAKELESFAQSWNQEMTKAGGSYTRQAVPKNVRRAASKAAKAEKDANPGLYANGEVAGHTPDVGWGGQTTGPFVPLSPEVNAYVGGATQAVPVGTTYTSVLIVP
jgi:RHS repeat-associated protein